MDGEKLEKGKKLQLKITQITNTIRRIDSLGMSVTYGNGTGLVEHLSPPTKNSIAVLVRANLIEELEKAEAEFIEL